jgi:hypothetical protein
MRKIATAAAALLAFTGTAFAGAKDKSSNTLVDITGAGIINNVTGKTKTKSKGCTLQIQAKPVAMADGEIAICIAEADVQGFGGNSIVIAGEAKSGQFKVKADLSEVKFAGLGCGDVEAISYNGNLRCYEDDPTYRTDGLGPGTWRDSCLDAGMSPGSPSGPTKLKANPTQSIVVGLCQGLSTGQRIDPPASPEWGRQGQRTATIP